VKQCSHEGCNNKVAEGGVYISHGAKVKRWCHEGCSNGAVVRGVCVTHGTKVKRCTTRDVTTMPGMEEFVPLMAQRGNSAASRGVPNKPNRREEFVTGIA